MACEYIVTLVIIFGRKTFSSLFFSKQKLWVFPVLALTSTSQTLYYTVHYNTVLDITWTVLVPQMVIRDSFS